MRRPFLPGLCGIISVIACSESNSPSAVKLAAPALQTPLAEVPIRQNDPTTGCSFSPTHGYGFQVSFSWTPIPDAEQYHIVLHHTGSPFAVLDAVVDDPSYTLLECNAYVIEENRFGWHWTAAGISATGAVGVWAEERTYEFESVSLPPSP